MILPLSLLKGWRMFYLIFFPIVVLKKKFLWEYELPLVGLDVRNVDCDSKSGVYTKEKLEEFLNSVINKCEPIDKDKLSLV